MREDVLIAQEVIEITTAVVRYARNRFCLARSEHGARGGKASVENVDLVNTELSQMVLNRSIYREGGDHEAVEQLSYRRMREFYVCITGQGYQRRKRSQTQVQVIDAGFAYAIESRRVESIVAALGFIRGGQVEEWELLECSRQPAKPGLPAPDASHACVESMEWVGVAGGQVRAARQQDYAIARIQMALDDLEISFEV
ncbi:MAG: hypothetical protein DMG78_32485, partial [Acidobacteria bacterium]